MPDDPSDPMVDKPPEMDAVLRAAQLEKLNAETEKLRAERHKLAQEAAAIPKQAKGAMWSEAIKILGAIVLGIGGVLTAVGGILTAGTQVEVAELRAKQADAALQSATALAKSASAEAADAVKLRDAARKETEESEKTLVDFRAQLAALTVQLREAKPELVTKRLVYVQFRGDLTRAWINDLRQSLESNGYNAPGAERLPGEYQNEVRFFRDEDQQAAENLAKRTEAYYEAKGCRATVRVTRMKALASSPPLELWLSQGCKT